MLLTCTATDLNLILLVTATVLSKTYDKKTHILKKSTRRGLFVYLGDTFVHTQTLKQRKINYCHCLLMQKLKTTLPLQF